MNCDVEKILLESPRRNFILTTNDRGHLLSTYESEGYDYEWSLYDLDDLVRYINNLPEKLKLYRLLILDDESDIDRESLGSHYSLNKKNLISTHMRDSFKGDNLAGDTYIITVNVDKDNVDILETLHNNILYPNEKEITLSNKGKGSVIINIEKL